MSLKKCFVVCPIGDEGSETRKRSDQLLKHIIEPVCQEVGYEAIRVDNENDSGSITQSIMNHLINDELVIADLTDHNPNCFYEIGYRTALNLPLIQIKSSDTETTIPFDISAIRTIDYSTKDLDIVENTKQKLIETIKTLPDIDKSGVIISDDDKFSKIEDSLSKIQTTLFSLSDKLSSYDTKTISTLVDKVIEAKKPSTMEDKLLDQLFPLLLNNPDQIDSLMKNLKKYEHLQKPND